jgi:L-threonylcarbamoyladenylate synthase
MYTYDLVGAIAALREGNLVVYPTDTLYALGADIYNESAVKHVFEVKNRPHNVPLPVAVSCFKDIEKIAFVNNNVKCLVNNLLPGPLTLILDKKDNISDIVTSGLGKIAVRIPDNKVALDLLSNFGPLTVTSANIHDSDVPFTINGIQRDLKQSVAVYIEHGRLDGSPSTIVDVTGDKPVIVREGIIDKREILECIQD